jgi:esterase/lipase
MKNNKNIKKINKKIDSAIKETERIKSINERIETIDYINSKTDIIYTRNNQLVDYKSSSIIGYKPIKKGKSNSVFLY